MRVFRFLGLSTLMCLLVFFCFCFFAENAMFYEELTL